MVRSPVGYPVSLFSPSHLRLVCSPSPSCDVRLVSSSTRDSSSPNPILLSFDIWLSPYDSDERVTSRASLVSPVSYLTRTLPCLSFFLFRHHTEAPGGCRPLVLPLASDYCPLKEVVPTIWGTPTSSRCLDDPQRTTPGFLYVSSTPTTTPSLTSLLGTLVPTPFPSGPPPTDWSSDPALVPGSPEKLPLLVHVVFRPVVFRPSPFPCQCFILSPRLTRSNLHRYDFRCSRSP